MWTVTVNGIILYMMQYTLGWIDGTWFFIFFFAFLYVGRLSSVCNFIRCHDSSLPWWFSADTWVPLPFLDWMPCISINSLNLFKSFLFVPPPYHCHKYFDLLTLTYTKIHDIFSKIISRRFMPNYTIVCNLGI